MRGPGPGPGSEEDRRRQERHSRHGVAEAKRHLRTEQEQIVADAQALEAERNAKLQQAVTLKLDLEYSRIVAPISGRISRAMLTEGNLVNAGGSDPLLTTIVCNDPMYIYFNIDERAYQRYTKAQHVDPEKRREAVRELKLPFSFELDTEEGYPHQGTLDFVDNKIDPTTGTIEVRGVVGNEQRQFVSGSRVRIRLPISNPYKALLVPDDCVLTDQDKRYVLVLGKGDVALRRDISPGRLLDDGIARRSRPAQGRRAAGAQGLDHHFGDAVGAGELSRRAAGWEGIRDSRGAIPLKQS